VSVQLNHLSRAGLPEVCRQFGVNLLVLFGSQAKGWAEPDSDIDIGVWIENAPEGWQFKARLWQALAELWDTGRVDLVVLNGASGALCYEVAATGQPLYESRPFLFQRFQVLAMKRYEDMKKIHRWNRQYVEDYLKERRRHVESSGSPDSSD
jgi:predicted nucleotidyltransferase